MKRLHYPHSTYPSRGRRPARDYLAETVNGQRKCEVCGTMFPRGTYTSGIAEYWSQFLKRKTCSRECKKVLIKGKGNPNYKGKMHIACRICGKDHLPYRTQNEPYRLCGECWNNNRKYKSADITSDK